MTKAAKDAGLPDNVYPKDGSYYFVRRNPLTGKTPWIRLTRITEGLRALQAKYDELQSESVVITKNDKRIVAVIAHFEANSDAFREYAEDSQKEARRQGRIIAEHLGNLSLEECSTGTVVAFLKRFAIEGKYRTYNSFRARVVQYFNHAALELDYKGQNHAAIIPQKDCPARTRHITDSELRRIKLGAIYSGKAEGQRPRNRSGLMMCAMIDMAALTGQRVGDLRNLKWSDIKEDGIFFVPGKLKKSTQVKIRITWTPKLRDVVKRLRELRMQIGTRGEEVFTTLAGNPTTKDGMKSLWRRACERAGIEDAHFHDLRAKAITDLDDSDGVDAAKTMGGHASEKQTRDYIRSRKVRSVHAAR